MLLPSFISSSSSSSSSCPVNIHFIFPRSHRMLINSTKASCRSLPLWRLSTPRQRLAATGEDRKTKGTPRTPEGLKTIPRKSCTRAGKEHQTTARSLPSYDLQTAPASQSRLTRTAGLGLKPQSDLFPFPSVLLPFIHSDIAHSGVRSELNRTKE